MFSTSIPNHDVKKIINNLIEHVDQFGDWDNPRYYNAETLKYILRGTVCVRLRA